ncbi:MAG: OmpA family protein [Planctomycetes bacterium]|nr:OmpA family protein [Planctomycetota bacterium]
MPEPGTLTADLPIAIEKKVRVAVSRKRRQHSAKRLVRESITCIRAGGTSFAFGKSFLRPYALTYLAKKLQARKATLVRHPDWHLTIFGHTDDDGSARHNKALSKRRAQSLYALICADCDIWEGLYQTEGWGRRELDQIIRYLGSGESADASVNSQDKRLDLFRRYMAEASLDYDGSLGLKKRFTTPPWVGCSEYNLITLYDKTLPKRKRRVYNARNRRVVMFFWAGKGPKRFPRCASTNCPGAARTSPLRGSQHFRCWFYHGHFAENRCESPVRVPIRRKSTTCAKLKALYKYLRTTRNQDKNHCECTLLRILEYCYNLSGARCVRHRKSDRIMDPAQYKLWMDEVYPGMCLKLSTLAGKSSRPIKEIRSALDAGRIPDAVRQHIAQQAYGPLDANATVVPIKHLGDRWVITDKTKKARYYLHYRPSWDIDIYLLGYRQMVLNTVSNASTWRTEIARVTPMTDTGTYEDREISATDYFNRRQHQRNFLKGYLLPVLRDPAVNKGGKFDPALATKKLTAGTARITDGVWYSTNIAILYWLEKHMHAMHGCYEDPRFDGIHLKPQIQFHNYYEGHRKQSGSIYSCFRRGSRTDMNHSFQNGTNSVVHNLCRDKNVPCDPTRCLRMS